eukprot:7352930-Alexandrium_andersonii.AAC.1
MMCDTQEIEGNNSIVKYICHMSKNISLPLLRARLLIKKQLAGACLKDCDSRNKFVDECAEAHMH